MKKTILLFSLILIAYFAQAQLSLESCQEKAKANYPLIKRYDLIEKSKSFNLINANKAYLPQLSLAAQATYQTVTTSLNMPGIPSFALPKDQYAASATISQIIYDGGSIYNEKQITQANAESEKAQLDAQMYELNDRVNQIFFGILLFNAQLDQIAYMTDNLQNTYEQCQAGVKNGVCNQSDLDVIHVEQLKMDQNTILIKANRKSFFQMLSALTGDSLSDSTVLLNPSEDFTMNTTINRPELIALDAQDKSLEAQKKLIHTADKPKIGLFLTGGISNPGLNMFKPGFSPYFMGGIKFSWNLSSLYTNSGNDQLIKTAQDNVAAQRETFLFNTQMQVGQESTEIQRNRDLLKADDLIIQLRENVRKASAAKVKHGTMTTNDLMRDLNSENQAKLDRIAHEVQLLQAIYKFKYTTNNN